MDAYAKAELRPFVVEWVSIEYPGAVEVALHSGQRFVFRTDDGRAVKLLPNLAPSDLERCRRDVHFLHEHQIDGLPDALSDLEQVEIADTAFSVYEEEWIDAGSLQEVLLDQGPSAELADAIVEEVGRMLTQIHAEGVVHRDISAGNVLVGESVYLVDFALAKYLSLDPLTQTVEQLKMTLLFASPEQLTSGSAGLRPPTDVYSLGLVAIYALNARHAFIEDDEMFDSSTYLARMAHRDFVFGIEVPEVAYEMLQPIASLRPTAEGL